MKAKILNQLLMLSVFFAGCAGREPNPISTYMPGDETRTCRALMVEMANCDKEMAKLKPKVNKFATNALWITAGVVFLVPAFFADLKEAEKIEYDAYQRRHNRLAVLAGERNCYAADPNDRDRKVAGYRVDTSRKDATGSFVTVPVFEDEKK